MKIIGQLLREKREEKKVSLEEVSVATKISIKILQAMEEGDLTKLPAKPFVRGFIQSYARYLGLDVKEILARFQESMGSTNPQTPISIPQSEDLNKNLPGSGRQIITVAAILLVIIAIIIIQRVVSKREAELRVGEMQAITGNDSPLKVPPSPNASASASASASAPTSPSPSASGSASPSPFASPSGSVTASLPLSPSTSPSTSPSSAAISPSPTPSPSPITSASPRSEVSTSPTTAPTPETKITANDENVTVPSPQEIIVEALDRVTIKMTIDSKPSQEITLNADQIQTFKAKATLKLYTPNGGAISVIHNGFDLGVPGNLGQPKQMAFPK